MFGKRLTCFFNVSKCILFEGLRSDETAPNRKFISSMLVNGNSNQFLNKWCEPTPIYLANISNRLNDPAFTKLSEPYFGLGIIFKEFIASPSNIIFPRRGKDFICSMNFRKGTGSKELLL